MRSLAIVLALTTVASHESAVPTPQVGALGARTAGAVISGQVVDGGSDGPLRNATVRASSHVLAQARETVTDSDGRFAFTGLPAGDYRLVASKRHYISQPYGRTRANDPAHPITVRDGDAVDDAHFVLFRGGVIAGTIVDEVGEPLDTVTVHVLGHEYTSTGRRLRTVARSRPTNDLGEYRVAGLPGGRYFLAATLPDPADDGVQTARVLDRVTYAPTYYPDATNVGAAERIAVRHGDVLSGHTIALKPVRIVSVHGRAVSRDGTPLRGRRVAAFLEGTNLDPIRITTAAEDGTFALRGLPASSYVLRADDERGGDVVRGAVRLTLEDADVSGVEIVASPAATLRGSLRLSGKSSKPVPLSTFRVIALAADHRSDAAGEAVPGPDLAFQLRSSGGRALLRVESRLPEWTLESVRMKGVDVTDVGIDVPASGLLAGLEIVMTNDRPSLDIEVVDGQGDPVTDTQVIVFSRDHARWSYASRYVALAHAVKGNRFAARVPPGRYLAVAIDEVEPGEWYDAEFLESVVPLAIEVDVAAGKPSTIRLSITR